MRGRTVDTHPVEIWPTLAADVAPPLCGLGSQMPRVLRLGLERMLLCTQGGQETGGCADHNSPGEAEAGGFGGSGGPIESATGCQRDRPVYRPEGRQPVVFVAAMTLVS